MSTSRTYDAIVVGVGTMGSAALHHLARRGARVLGLEQFDVVHERGSMHGETRIVRLAYHEDARYVALLRRAYELWRELDPRLLHVCGSLDLGAEDGAIVGGALQTCREHDLAHELLTAAEVERRFPAWRLPADAVGLLQADGGYVAAEASVRAHVAAAQAEVHTREAVLDWDATPAGVRVRTTLATYRAARLVLCPGAWAPGLLRLRDDLFTVERQVVAWLDFTGELPVFVADLHPAPAPAKPPPPLVRGSVEPTPLGANYYGIAAHGRVKVGRMHHPGTAVSPAANGPVEEHELEPLVEFARSWLPSAGEVSNASACLFTTTPDRNFVIDLHPDADNVVVVSACSGHGFKFAPVVGEIVADLALTGDTEHPIDFLRLR